MIHIQNKLRVNPSELQVIYLFPSSKYLPGAAVAAGLCTGFYTTPNMTAQCIFYKQLKASSD